MEAILQAGKRGSKQPMICLCESVYWIDRGQSCVSDTVGREAHALMYEEFPDLIQPEGLCVLVYNCVTKLRNGDLRDCHGQRRHVFIIIILFLFSPNVH